MHTFWKNDKLYPERRNSAISEKRIWKDLHFEFTVTELSAALALATDPALEIIVSKVLCYRVYARTVTVRSLIRYLGVQHRYPPLNFNRYLLHKFKSEENRNLGSTQLMSVHRI